MAAGAAAASTRRWVDTILRTYGGHGLPPTAGSVDRGSVPRAVHRDDEMLLEAIETSGGDRRAGVLAYFLTGCQVAGLVRQLAERQRGPDGGAPRLLDMGCGYGRLGRHLTAAAGVPPTLIHPDRVWVSDLLEGALRFQAECFGFHAFASTTDPASFEAPSDFDLIWVGSLFTHLREERFGAWLEVLFACLAPGGMLAFTVHDKALVPTGYRPGDAGMLHLPSSETRTLNSDDYGTSWVSWEFVERLLELLPGPPYRRLRPRAVAGYQDMWVVKKDLEEGAIDPAAVEVGPRGMLEWLAIDRAGELEVSGWAWHPTREVGVAAVEVAIDGQVRATIDEFADRRDVTGATWVPAGFAATVPVPARLDRSEVLLEVRMRSHDGQLWPLRVGSLESLLGAVARERLEAERLRAFSLEREIDWMRQSRFWRLRERWFKFKQKFGGST